MFIFLFQIDLGKAYHVTHIVIRGDEAGSYVSLFRLLHSDDNIRWHPYSEDNIVDKVKLVSNK